MSGKKMIRQILSLLLIATLVLGLSGCGDRKKQDALLAYINTDLTALSEMEAAMMKSYSSVIGNDETSDMDIYQEITQVTIVKARDLNDAATALAAEIEDDEIYDIHWKYVESTGQYLTAFSLLAEALESQSYAQLAEVNTTLSAASKAEIDFQRSLKKLADARGVTFEATPPQELEEISEPEARPEPVDFSDYTGEFVNTDTGVLGLFLVMEGVDIHVSCYSLFPQMVYFDELITPESVDGNELHLAARDIYGDRIFHVSLRFDGGTIYMTTDNEELGDQTFVPGALEEPVLVDPEASVLDLIPGEYLLDASCDPNFDASDPNCIYDPAEDGNKTDDQLSNYEFEQKYGYFFGYTLDFGKTHVVSSDPT